jgi:hypothetical protein
MPENRHKYCRCRPSSQDDRHCTALANFLYYELFFFRKQISLIWAFCKLGAVLNGYGLTPMLSPNTRYIYNSWSSFRWWKMPTKDDSASTIRLRSARVVEGPYSAFCLQSRRNQQSEEYDRLRTEQPVFDSRCSPWPPKFARRVHIGSTPASSQSVGRNQTFIS